MDQERREFRLFLDGSEKSHDYFWKYRKIVIEPCIKDFFPMMMLIVGFVSFILGLLLYHLRSQKFILENSILKEKLMLQETLQKEANDKLELKLKEITRQMLDEKSKQLKDDSMKSLETLLSPFKDKMGEFQRKVEEIHLMDTKDRLKLHTEIERIVLSAQKMGQETENLTRALKGDVKIQGNWGELILEKVLEASGLREGEEFTLQGKDMKLKDEDGKHLMPDVIINLPDNKHLIIDSKVSLVAYERYINQEQDQDLSFFLDSLYEHIRGLSKKSYQQLEKLVTPDYVMLFVPIEGAFTLAMQKDKELFQFAWERNVVIVSPSTMLATLRTVASLWKQERQSKNALEMARQAGALYDKFVGVAQDLDTIQNQIKKTSEAMEDLRGKMLTGKGSMASRMENLRELGAKNTKNLEVRPS